MADSAPKISFGFSKLVKKPNLPPPKPEIVKKIDRIQFIDSLENNSFNVINDDGNEKKELLVIPMKNPNTLLDSVKKAVNSRLPLEDEKLNGTIPVVTENLSVQEPKPAEPDSSKIESLDEMAAREIIEDSKKLPKEVECTTVIPLSSQKVENVESTLEDYENVPVSDFGLAMLRGMGWEPAKGVGKTEQVIKVTQPALRPKGMGLGADKVINRQKPAAVNVSADNVLKKGSKVRVTVGKQKNSYGTVEAFDDSLGRISVKMALSNETISINECYTQLVTSEEFNKYSKLININTYSSYVENENKSSRNKESNIEKSKELEVDSNGPKTNSSRHQGSKEQDSRGKNERIFEESSDSDDSHRQSSKSKELSRRRKQKSSEVRKGHQRHRSTSENSSGDSDLDRRRRNEHEMKKSQHHSDSSSDDGRRSKRDKSKQKLDKKNSKSRQRNRFKEEDSDSSYTHKKKKSKKGKHKSRSRSRSLDRRRR